MIRDEVGRPFCRASCQFLTLAVRGTVPEPATVPGQIIDGGFDGVVKMISAMFPKSLKAISTTRDKAPADWTLVPRDAKPKADPDHPKGKAAKVPPKRTDVSKPPKVATAPVPSAVEPEPEPELDRPRVVAGPMPTKKPVPVATGKLDHAPQAQLPAPETEGVEG